MQEWVYDAWWGRLTDDKELPADVRRLLNNAFGELAARFHRVDKTSLIARDCVGRLAAQIRAWHISTDNIGLVDPSHSTWSARDRALRCRLTSPRLKLGVTDSKPRLLSKEGTPLSLSPSLSLSASLGRLSLCNGWGRYESALPMPLPRCRRREMQSEGLLHQALAEEGGMEAYMRRLSEGMVTLLFPETNDVRMLFVLLR